MRCQCDYYPEAACASGRCRFRAQAGQTPGLLFCLAPQKVFRAPDIAGRAVGFYPAFSPLPTAFAAGGLFSVTLSVASRFRALRPWILRGLLSDGVRTFLSRANRSDRLPARRPYLGRVRAQGFARLVAFRRYLCAPYVLD